MISLGKPREKKFSLMSSNSDTDVRKSINRLTFKEELKVLKSSEENDYKEQLNQLLSNYGASQSPSVSRMESNISINSSNSSRARSLLKIPSLKLPFNTGLSLSEGSPASPCSTNPSESNQKSNKRLSLKLNPINSISNTVSKVGFKSRPGKTQASTRLQNQDQVKLINKVHNIRGVYLFLVIDGHGTDGHLVSKQIKKIFSSHFKQSFPAKPTEDRIKKSLLHSFEKTSSDLTSSNLDIVFSGATVTAIVISGSNIVCGNLGTCRVVSAQDLGKWQPVTLTVDHDLSNLKEKKRMVLMNARIVKMVDMYGFDSEIFFVEKEDLPGLSITRSIGDKIGKYAGMLSIPDISTFTLTSNDKFLIIGTENFWKALSPTEAICVARLGWSQNSVEQSCDDLIAEAERKLSITSGVKDDLTVIVIFMVSH